MGDDYRAATSYRLGLIALSSPGGVYFVGTHDAFGLRIGNRFLLVTNEVTYKFREVSIVLLSYGIGAQFQQHENPASRVISCDRSGLGRFTLSGVNLACAQDGGPALYHKIATAHPKSPPSNFPRGKKKKNFMLPATPPTKPSPYPNIHSI